jgi:RNA polymerase sigma-70 factor (ECF subfamily)
MKKNQRTDEELVALYVAGNNDCMEMLINRHKSKIYTAINMVVKDTYIAEDIFQETFIKVIHLLQKGLYTENGKFISWVIRIARNLAIDHYRVAKKRPTIYDSENHDIFKYMQFSEPNYLENNSQQYNKNTIRNLIKQLPAEQMEILILRHYGDLSFKEIAELCNCSINTALGRMRYAIINLKKMIEEKAISF